MILIDRPYGMTICLSWQDLLLGISSIQWCFDYVILHQTEIRCADF